MKNLIAVLVATLVLVPAISLAQTCRLLDMADELKLTDQQIEAIQTNLMSHKKEMIQLKADLGKAKLELQEIMLAKEIDKNAALKKGDAISSIKATMAQKRLLAKIDRLNILTADQRSTVRKQMMLHGQGRGKGMHHGMGMGRGMGPCMEGMGGGMGSGMMRNMRIEVEKEIEQEK